MRGERAAPATPRRGDAHLELVGVFIFARIGVKLLRERTIGELDFQGGCSWQHTWMVGPGQVWPGQDSRTERGF